MTTRASAKVAKTSSFKHSSRSLPLKLSTKPFYCGLPGAMSCHSTPVRLVHSSMARLGHLGPVVADDHRRFAAARRIIEEWRNDYNEHRPHTSLCGLTPNEFATRSRSNQKENRVQL